MNARTSVAKLTPPSEWAAGEPIEPACFEALSEDEMLTELENIERLSAWLAARAVAVTEQLVETREQASLDWFDTRYPDATTAQRNSHLGEIHAGLEDEMALATGVTSRTAHTRVAMVLHDAERSAPIRDALARGHLSWARAMQVFQKAGIAPVEAVPDIVARCIAPYPARSTDGVGGLLVPQAIFTARLNRRLAAVTTAPRRHADALDARSTFVLLQPGTGTGTFTVSGHAARIAGAHNRVDEIARRLRREGDSRTLAQLRSDVALDLLIHGQMPTPDGLPGLDSETFTAYSTFAGHLPPALVHVTVSMSALMGATEEPGTLDVAGRQEWLCAQVIRDAAFAAGSTWKRLVTDPTTGYMADLSTGTYAVTGHLRDRIVARDRISRAPGSATPARLCDTDHDLDHALGGPTSESNVSAKHRRGHNHKTRHTWRSSREPGINGVITWTTPTGRTYTTTPWDHRDPDPPTPEQLAVKLDASSVSPDGPPSDPALFKPGLATPQAWNALRAGSFGDHSSWSTVKGADGRLGVDPEGTTNIEVQRVDSAALHRHADITDRSFDEAWAEIITALEDELARHTRDLLEARAVTDDREAPLGHHIRRENRLGPTDLATAGRRNQDTPPPF